jgi:hypothetical protein
MAKEDSIYLARRTTPFTAIALLIEPDLRPLRVSNYPNLNLL